LPEYLELYYSAILNVESHYISILKQNIIFYSKYLRFALSFTRHAWSLISLSITEVSHGLSLISHRSVGQDGGLATWSWQSGAWFDVVVDRVGQDRRAVKIGVVCGF